MVRGDLPVSVALCNSETEQPASMNTSVSMLHTPAKWIQAVKRGLFLHS